MHPQTVWLTSIYALTEQERRRALLHRNDVARGEEPPPAATVMVVPVAAEAPQAPNPAPSAQVGCA